MAGSKVRKIVDRWQKKLKRSGRSYISLESPSSLSTGASDLEEFDHHKQQLQEIIIEVPHQDQGTRASQDPEAALADAFVVYVGKDARRYVVEARHLKHPLFRSLVQKSSNLDEALVKISCEVVMFEHLLWMLENYDPEELHGEAAIDELLDMYSTS